MHVSTLLTSAVSSVAPAMLLVAAAGANAHTYGDGSDFSPWRPDMLTSLLLLMTALVYWRGQHNSESSPREQTRRHYWFWAGWLMLAVALSPPIDPMGNALFSVHMIQHELMMLGAAPLLVMSRPSASLLRGLPRAGARAIGTLLRNTGGSRWLAWLGAPLNAWIIHAVGLWGWHVPALFNAGLRSDLVHTAQHISFLFIALVFWFALLKPKQTAPAANVVYLFTTALHASMLGALLTFSSRVWYTPYQLSAPQWGFTALADQQLGGLIMWMPAGLAFLLAGLASLAAVIRSSDHNQATLTNVSKQRNTDAEHSQR
jgi:putative membrane protein